MLFTNTEFDGGLEKEMVVDADMINVSWFVQSSPETLVKKYSRTSLQ